MPTEKTDGRRASLRAVMPVASTNAGLWLDGFLNRGGGEAPVRDLIVKALKSIKPPDGYPGAFARRETALESLDGGFEGGMTRFWTGIIQGRMIVGIGAASVRETGISLLRTWGMPFIPGSALKGVAASMARKHAGDAWKPGTPGHHALFGDQLLSGCVVFHDAWWIPAAPGECLPLDLDVMTVHHGTYYGGGDEAPCDWDEPNPVAFITARAQYLVALSGPASWVEAAGTLLAAGLTELGIGAKTAAGYGRVKLVRKPTKAEDEQARTNQERAKKAAPLRDLATRFKGASNANDLVKELLRAQREGADPADVRSAAVNLWRRDPKFWKQWSKKPSRSAEEREIMAPPLDREVEKTPR
jgi:CRISPR-associated protein Cmr6